MDNNIEKKHLFGHMVHDKDDYGIYTYFNYNDTVYRSKLISAIYENQYILISDHCDKCDHYCMRNDIEELFGDFKCFLGSSGNELNVFISETLSNNQIVMLIDIFNELKTYYIDKGVNKRISFIGHGLESFEMFRDCLDIDKIIEELIKMKNEKIIENKKSGNIIIDLVNKYRR